MLRAQRSLRRRHPRPRRHRDRADLPRGAGGRPGVRARAPAGHGRASPPAAWPTDATDIFQEGLVIPPERLYRGGRAQRDPGRPHRAQRPRPGAGLRRPGGRGGRRARPRPAACERLIEQLRHRHLPGGRPRPPGPRRAADPARARADPGRRLRLRRLRRQRRHRPRPAAHDPGAGHDPRLGPARGLRRDQSPQARGPANCAAGHGPAAAVYYVVRALTGSHIPNNSGCFRPVTVSAPSGSPGRGPTARPRSRSAITPSSAWSTPSSGALAPALPDRIPAASHGSDLCMSWGGVDPDDRRAHFVYMECTAGGTGATWAADGDRPARRAISATAGTSRPRRRSSSTPCGIWAQPPARRLRRRRPVPRRAGRRAHRRAAPRRGHREPPERPPLHAALGPPRRPGRARGGPRVIRRADGAEEMIPGRMVFTLQAGDRVVACTGGGGGYGRPGSETPTGWRPTSSTARCRSPRPASATVSW